MDIETGQLGTLTATLDPHKHFNVEPERILQAIGIIPMWLSEGNSLGFTFKQSIEAFYQFGVYEMTGSEIDSEGISRYPGDPDRYPLIMFLNMLDEELYIYESSIVSIKDADGKWFTTRLD